MADTLTPIRKLVAVDTLDPSGAHAPLQHPGANYRLKVGQRFHRVGFTAVVWRVLSVYRDAQGLEHAAMIDEAGRLDEKTLSASVLLDRSHYTMIAPR